VRVTGLNQGATYPIAQDLQARLTRIRGLVDVHLHQIVHAPALYVEVDRTRAVDLGLMQRDVANNLLVTLSGNRFVSPNFWADPRTGIPYPLVVQTPQYRIDALESVRNISMAVNVGQAGQNSKVRRYSLLYYGPARLVRTMDLEEVFEALESNLHFTVAVSAQRRIFMHAGVVGWRGRAIVIPGRSMSGKTTLVAELVTNGVSLLQTI